MRRITDETISSIVTSVQTWLNKIQAETEQELQRLEKQSNDQVRLAANLQTQIFAIQKQLDTFRREGDIKFRRVILLLQKTVHLQQMPKPLQVLVEQYLKNPSDILNQALAFSEDVHFWKSCIEKLGAFISSLDAFTTISIIKNAAKVELSSRKDITLKQATNLRVQLDEAEVQLQQQFDNLTFERAWWQQVWQAIPAHLKPTVLSNSLKANLETVKLLVASPAKLYIQSKITAREYAMSVEIKVSFFVRTLPFESFAKTTERNETSMYKL